MAVPPNGGIVPEPAKMAERLATTCPAMLIARARREPDIAALYDKRFGIHAPISWRQYRDAVAETALGLAALGVKAGDRVAIMGDPCPEWLYADMAIMAIGAITVGVYPTSAPVEVAYILEDSGVEVFIAETQEHLDKLLAVIGRVPRIRRIVVIDMRALFKFEHPMVVSFETMRAAGRAAPGQALFDDRVAAVGPDDAAAIVYTSGTTGAPKGAVLSHRNLVAGAWSYVNCKPDIREREHRVVAHLPLSHVVARILVLSTPLVSRLVPFFCEEIDDFAEAVREVAPNFAVMPPRFYEKFAAQLLVAVETSTPLKRWAYRQAMRAGTRALSRRRVGRSLGPALWLANALARVLVFKQLLEKAGFARLDIAFTGSAPMPPQIVRLWQSWGVDLREVYGVTECCGISIAQYRAFPEPGDIGVACNLPGFEFKLSAEGEIFLRSPMVFKCYWGNEAATREAIDPEGWYRTGDVAERKSDGSVRLIDRMKDIFVTLGGKSLSPQQIEKVIKGSPYISEAVAFGDGRRYITALLELDYTSVSEWARAFRVPYTSYGSLVARPEVAELIGREIQRANDDLARVEQVKEFRIIPVELDPEQGETTPTRKIKRKVMHEMFKELVESMYKSDSEHVIDRHTASA